MVKERTDVLRRKDGGGEITLPVKGVFDIIDGQIAAWRDGFDIATITLKYRPQKCVSHLHGRSEPKLLSLELGDFHCLALAMLTDAAPLGWLDGLFHTVARAR